MKTVAVDDRFTMHAYLGVVEFNFSRQTTD